MLFLSPPELSELPFVPEQVEVCRGNHRSAQLGWEAAQLPCLLEYGWVPPAGILTVVLGGALLGSLASACAALSRQRVGISAGGTGACCRLSCVSLSEAPQFVVPLQCCACG